MSSTTGRSPACAAPTAIPMKAVSETGVSKTRRPPNWRASPLVAPNTPPSFATSSPKTTTEWSRSISWRRAAATRWDPVRRSGDGSGLDIGEDMFSGGLLAGQGPLAGRGEPFCHRLRGPVLTLLQPSLRSSAIQEPFPELEHGVPGPGRLLLLPGRPVQVQVALVMAAEAVHGRNHQARAALVPGDLERLPDGLIDPVDIRSVAGKPGDPERFPAPAELGARGPPQGSWSQRPRPGSWCRLPQPTPSAPRRPAATA